MTGIQTVYRWYCSELGCRTYYEHGDKRVLRNAIKAHEAVHRVQKEERENQERTGNDN